MKQSVSCEASFFYMQGHDTATDITVCKINEIKHFKTFLLISPSKAIILFEDKNGSSTTGPEPSFIIG